MRRIRLALGMVPANVEPTPLEQAGAELLAEANHNIHILCANVANWIEAQKG